MLAIGDKTYTQIVRTKLQEYPDSFSILDKDVFHRDYLDEIIELDTPDILILHDFYLASRETTAENKDLEMIRFIQKLRIDYDDKIRVVYLCERDNTDAYLSNLVSINVLDIFNTPQINIETFIKQLLEEPKFKNVSKFLGGEINLIQKANTVGTTNQEDNAKETETIDTDAVVEKDIDEKPNVKVEKKIVNKVVQKKIVQKQVVKREYQIQVNNHIEKVIGVTIEPKLILVGSPYKRTGTTWFAHSLAKSIADQGVGVSYIENPFLPGYTYDRFNGHNNTNNYISAFAERVFEQRSSLNGKLGHVVNLDDYHSKWIHEDVRLIALNPELENPYVEQDIDLQMFMKLLLSLHKTPFVIIDIGNDWFREVYRELYTIADITYIVMEPDIPLYERLQTSNEHGLNKIRKMLGDESTYFIGNKVSREIAEELFENANYLIPFINSKDMFQMQYNATFMPNTKETVKSYFDPILKDVLPKDFLKQKQKENSVFRKLFKSRGFEIKKVK